MKISYEWLNDYIDLSDISPDKTAEQLTMKSAEVDKTELIGQHFEKVITAKVENVVPHPDSERLKLATVFDGKNRQTVVCGAPNVAVGQVVPFAPVGTVLPGDFEIKPAKIRGVESCGMICAEDELGLGTDHEGIMVLDSSLQAGIPLTELFGRSDFVIEIENKTINHRPDMWGHYGVARELRAIFKKPWKKQLVNKSVHVDKVEEKFQIVISTDKCLHYTGVKMSGIKIGPTPEWMKRRLNNIGVRSINNVVDISNYVMFETGHPVHIFDRRDISGDTIIIREADENEPFITLDNETRLLNKNDAVIADKTKSLAIAGVMGGQNSEVKDDTTEIFIEAALFLPSSVRRTANRLDLRTDSASRFEKGLWVENAHIASQRVVELVKEIIPEAVVSSQFHSADNSLNYGFKGDIEIPVDKIYSLTGIVKEKLTDEVIIDMLSHLDFQAVITGGVLKVTVPEHRRSKDVSIAEDIIEEIGRIYGYNLIDPVSPLFKMERGLVNEELVKTDRIKDLLVKSFGAAEVMNYPFCGRIDLKTLPFPEEKLIETVDERENPFLRYSMFPAMMKNVYDNLKNFKEFALFEVGKVFTDQTEKKRVAVILTGESVDFNKMKEIAVSIIREMKTPPVRFERIKDAFLMGDKILHPNRSAVMMCGKEKLMVFGMVHPERSENFEISIPVGYLETECEALFGLPEKNTRFSKLMKYPSTGFDITVIVPERTEVGTLLDIIKRSVDKKIFVESRIIDFFSGDPIPAGFNSISFRIVLNGTDRTLTSEEMKDVQQQLFKDVREKGFRISGD